MIAGVSVEVGNEAVVVRSSAPLRVLSSAVHLGGFAQARAIVNLHVGKDDPCADPAGMIGAFARRAGVPAPWAASTINTIVVVGADPEPAALVNAVITATEVKGLALREAGLQADTGHPASGTSTDAVVIAATDRGPAARFGGPASEMGWVVARAVRVALDRAIADWQEHHR